jgi:anti-sigma factor ChrR (cupin superfamily)
MSDSRDDMDAALWAAGALTKEECAALVERLRSDPAFAARAREWEDALAPLAEMTPAIDPPKGLLDKIEARIEARAKLETLSRTLRAEEGVWINVARGIRVKELHRNAALGRRTILLDIEPGALYPAHAHEQDEEIFVISGDLTIGGEELGPGDFHVSPKGSRHPSATTRAGCRCIVSMAI